MKKRFTEGQIAFAHRQASNGTPAAEIIRKMGITEQTFYRWKRLYAQMGLPEIHQYRQWEEEDRRLKRLVAELTLDKQMMQDVLSKKLCGLPFAESWSERCKASMGQASNRP
jgi:putative transposase